MAEPTKGSDGNWPNKVTDPHAPDDSAGPAQIPEAVMKAGHEPDLASGKSIVPVPLAVLAFFVIAFGTTTALVAWVLIPGKLDKLANPQAVKQNSADLNTRIGRIDHDPKKQEQQPRLEWIRETNLDDQAVNFTAQPTIKGNSPEFHPEDLRPTGKYASELGLDSNDKGMIPIEFAMKIAAEKAKGILPVAEKPVDPTTDPFRPKVSNGGGQPLVGNAEKK